METSERKHIAVLIDAENISAKYSAIIFDEIEKCGYDAPCRRIYGNWSARSGWKEDLLLEYSILPIQQFSYTHGKNSTDMAMVIDAMDLLYQNKFDGFCLVTSDSDFTRLAMRLREEQKFVLGMGESKAPMALTHACDRFIHLNLIDKENDDPKTESEDMDNVTPVELLEKAVLEMLSERDDGCMGLGLVGNRLSKKFPDFDARNYGYSKLSVFISDNMPHLEIVMNKHMPYVKKSGKIDRKEVEKAVFELIREKGGQIDNLAWIYEEMKKRISGFDFKDYGYDRMSSFVRSIDGLSVFENSVRIHASEKERKKKRR